MNYLCQVSGSTVGGECFSLSSLKEGECLPDLALPLREECLYNSANILYKKFPKRATRLSWLQHTESILLIQQCDGGHDKEMGMGNHILPVIKLCIVIATFWLV